MTQKIMRLGEPPEISDGFVGMLGLSPALKEDSLVVGLHKRMVMQAERSALVKPLR